MSAYIQFFIRHNDDFLPIGVFSRNNTIYQVFDEIAPWEKIRPISDVHLNKVRASLKDFANDIDRTMKRIENREKLIATFDNSVEEKLEALENSTEYKMELEEERVSYKMALGYVNSLYEILDSIEYDKRFDMGAYLYVGIEVGDPTVEDLI